MTTMAGECIESHVPARLDRMPWSRWHWLIVGALGATWILDGLEVTLAGSLAGILTHRETLGLTDAQVGASATFYLAGAVIGALLFGYGTDELIPARFRGRVALFINCSYWIGAAMGSAATIVLLDPHYLPVWLGWRLAFGIGAILGLVVIFFRRWIPESPRWLLIHGRGAEAERIVDEVERTLTPDALPPHDDPPTRVRTRTHTPWGQIWHTIMHEHRRRSILGFVLMLTQAFFYNAIFFTYGLVLMRFYGVPAQNVGGYLMPFALGNVLGPLLLGHLFDTVGRKKMITATYAVSGLLLALTGWLFHAGMLTAQTQT